MSYRDLIPPADPLIPMCPLCLTGRLLRYASPVQTATTLGARVCDSCGYTITDTPAVPLPTPDPRQSGFGILSDAWR